MATAVGSFVATGGNIGARLAEALRFCTLFVAGEGEARRKTFRASVFVF